MAQVSIFVSHSHQDDEWCRPMVAALKAVGYDVWYDETGLAGGDAWVATIQREVQTRDVFLLVLTPEAWASPWVQDELNLAIATRRRILPVLLRNTQVDGFILTTQWVTVVGEEPQVAARAIIKAIESPPAPGRGAPPAAAQETLDDLITLCTTLLAERRYTEALSACDRALGLDPNNVEVLKVKGNVLNQIGQPKRAAAIFAQALFLLNPATADVATAGRLAQFVFDNSDDAATIVQVCRTQRQFLPVEPGLIYRLVQIGAVKDAADLLSEFDDERSDMAEVVFRDLAQNWRYGQNNVDAVLQLGALTGKQDAAIRQLAKVWQIDAVMPLAPQVRHPGTRRDILDALSDNNRYEDIDRLCRHWFGYPPTVSAAEHPDIVKANEASLAIWRYALVQLGQRREAETVRKIRERTFHVRTYKG